MEYQSMPLRAAHMNNHQIHHLRNWSITIPSPRNVTARLPPQPQPQPRPQQKRQQQPQLPVPQQYSGRLVSSVVPSMEAYPINSASVGPLPSQQFPNQLTTMFSDGTDFEYNNYPTRSYATTNPMTPPSMPHTPDDEILHFHDDASCYSESSSFFPSCHMPHSYFYHNYAVMTMKTAPACLPSSKPRLQLQPPLQPAHAASMPSLPSSSSLSSTESASESKQASAPESSTARSEVDNLMKSLQQPEQPVAPILVSPSKVKRHICPYSDCLKSFSQPTHLKIHLRSHTGEKPYTCSVPSCRQSFSQLGNLRTHERRHAGRPPNRKKSISDRSKRYECILDDCRISAPGYLPPRGKEFTQLGNLKAHMNKFHKETLARLIEHFATTDDENETDEDCYLRAYFQDLYRNSNKGIKGRGKGRKVHVITTTATASSARASGAATATATTTTATTSNIPPRLQ